MTETARSRPYVAGWLFAIAALVFAMIVVGGLTRLTDSGLSITEWKPVTGALPPISQQAWDAEFAKYQAIPEYALQNRGMSLSEFKALYWWEWGHRLLGRAIGLVFLLPLIGFWVLGRLRRDLAPRLVGIFILGGLQGAVGWWMVASGLVDRVDVSQYRLAAHLGLAFALFALVWWSAFDALEEEPATLAFDRPALIALGFAGLVFAQIILGAFVAGLDAGRVHTTWPLMDGGFAPRDYARLEPFWRNLFENPAAAQLHHRLVGYLVAIAAAALAYVERGRLAYAILALVLFQVALGITTLMHAAPLPLSAAHQATAVAVFAAALSLARARASRPRAPSPAPAR